MPIPLAYTEKPRTILLFDAAADYGERLTAALALANIAGEVETVEAALAFRLALARPWDAILVNYTVAQEALASLSRLAPDQEIILLYDPQAEEQAFALTAEPISDLVSCKALHRLPLILRRAWKRQARQPNAPHLRQLETRLRAIMEGFGGSILITDAYQIVQYANSAFGRAFGYQLSDLLGKSFVTLLHPLDQGAFQLSLSQRLAAVGSIETMAHRLQCANGDWAFVETTGHNMHDPEGQAFLVLRVRDISEQKQAEGALRESMDWMRLALEASNLGKWQHDLASGLLHFDERACHHYGFATPTVTLDMLLNQLHPDDIRRFGAEINATLDPAHDGRYAAEYRVIHPNGELHWLAVQAQVYFEGVGESRHPTFGFGTSQDITAHKQAEAAEQERRLLAEAMRDSLAALTSTLDVETVMQQILTLSAQVVPSEAGAIVLFAEHQGRVAYARGHAPQAEAFFNANPITFNAEVYTKGEDDQLYYLVTDTKLAPGWVTFPTTDWIRSSIGVPIVIHDKPIGLLTADSRTPNQYGQKDVTNLQTFARYAALALENAHHVTHLEQRVQARTAELEATKTQVEAILDNSPDGLLLINPDLTIQQANLAFHQLFACEPAECHGQSLLERIDQADIAQVKALLPTVITDAQRKQLEIHALRKDGTSFDAELSVGLIKDDGLVCVIRDITARKVQERQLRYHASLQETVSDAVIVTDMASRVQSWNPAAERIYGWRAAEAVGRTMGELVQTQFTFPEERAYLLERLQAQGWWHGEFIQQRKGGQICHILSSAALVNDENGNPIGIVAVNHDITERKQAEDALQKSAAEIRDLYNNAPCGYQSLDQDGLIVQINDTQLRWLGYTRAEVVGRLKFADIITTASMQLFHKNFPFFKARGWVSDLEFELVRKDGTTQPVLLSSIAVYNDDGHYVQSRSTLFDITELRQTQQAIVASEAKYRLLVETMRGGLVMFDADDRATYMNDRFCELVGYPRAALMGQKPFAHLEGQNVELVKAQLERRRQLQSSSYELTLQRADGQTVHLLVSGSPLLDQAGNYQGGFAVVTDITAQKQAEAALRQALAKEKELSDLKSRFVSVASHEFRTPLATISATTETLITYRDRLDGNQLNARLHKILVQVDHMKAIMEDVLQLARIQAGRVELLLAQGDLNALCCEIVEEFSSRPEYKERIIYTVAGSPSTYYFDARLLRHVVSNLISNGLKYSPAAQPITVELHWGAQVITLQVCDQGIGIPDADRQHLFEPFHRASNVGNISGTGLGLSITKEAVEMHGGTIQIATEINSGTTVTVVLPTAPERIITDVKNPDY